MCSGCPSEWGLGLVSWLYPALCGRLFECKWKAPEHRALGAVLVCVGAC